MPIRATVFALLAVLLAVGTAHAGEWTKFDAKEFAAAQAAGKSIVVAVSAPWCPTCKAQKPIIDGLAAKPEYKDVLVLEIDFDTGRDSWKALNARSQSTLIAYKGAKETGRSAGDTNSESIEALFKSTL
jgi:thiol-disulfide isomerase/thioredoxin